MSIRTEPMIAKTVCNYSNYEKKAKQKFHWSDANGHRVRRVVFLTLENYSLIALSNALEPLRAANKIAGRQVYEWVLTSMNGVDSVASNGLKMSPTISIQNIDAADIVFVCGGAEVERATTPALVARLKQLDANKIPVGSLCTGVYCLAMAGLLYTYESVVHWKQKNGMAENFPRARFSDRLFFVDRNRYTCTGGLAPLHLMLKIIGEQLGPSVAVEVSKFFAVDRILFDDYKQHVPMAAYAGKSNTHVIEATSLMDSHLEDTLGIQQIARLVGISKRQIQRLFKRYIGVAPTKYYLDLRLDRARSLLFDTSLTVIQISVACGFQSAPHFSKCYRDRFGITPSAQRYTSPIRKLALLQ